MKKLTSTIVFILFGTFLYSQDEIPTKNDLKKAKIDTSLSVITLFKKYKNWEQVAKFDYKTRQYKIIESKPAQISILDEKTVNYITPTDRLNIIDKNSFEIIFGGSGPERVTYMLITAIGKYLILEAKSTSQGYLNGKLVYEKKYKLRYVWKLREE